MRRKVSRALMKEDKVYGQRWEEMAKKHSGRAFHALDDPWDTRLSRYSWS